jgi:hypothetical protein
MRRFIRGLRRLLARSLDRFWALGIPFPGFNMPVDAGQEELREERDKATPGEPQEQLPHAEISEAEREGAVREYKREMEEKGRR